MIFINENAFENVVSKLSIISSRSHFWGAMTRATNMQQSIVWANGAELMSTDASMRHGK